MHLFQDIENSINTYLVGQYPDYQNINYIIKLEKPSRKEFGDLSLTAPLALAKHLKNAPIKIAQNIHQYLTEEYSNKNLIQVNTIMPGFVNITFTAEAYAQLTHDLLHNNQLEPIASSSNILLEYVSANPTGDLHLGHGRGAVLGSCLVKLLKYVGHNVKSEYYLNDAGEQITKLTESAWALQNPEYISEIEQYPKELIEPYLPTDIIENKQQLGNIVKQNILIHQKKVLTDLRVPFDQWVSELVDIHETNVLKNTLQKLQDKDLVYTQDNAIWLKSKQLGDERDRVLVKSDGRFTYLMGDIAYHADKYERLIKQTSDSSQDYILLNIWGADHAGQDKSLKLALQALDYNPDKLNISFLQLVSLQKNGVAVKMSKRAGTLITIEEVIEEVGVDAFRATMLTSNANNCLIFDLESIKQTNEENPAFYLQYSHARACSIIRRACEPNIETNQILINKEQLFNNEFQAIKNLEHAYNTELLSEAELKASQLLLMKLCSFNKELIYAAETLNPCHILNYLMDLASLFHSFYNIPCTVIDYNNLELSISRLALVSVFQQIMQKGLNILDIHAPESM